jgi:hypothetical protein
VARIHRRIRLDRAPQFKLVESIEATGKGDAEIPGWHQQAMAREKKVIGRQSVQTNPPNFAAFPPKNFVSVSDPDGSHGPGSSITL